MCTIISSKRGSNQQLPFLSLDMFISLAARGLSNRLPSLALFITTQQFNIKGLCQQPSYSWTNLLLSNSPIRKGLINNNPFYRWTRSSFQQQKASTTNYPSLAALLPNSSTSGGFVSWVDLLLSSNPIRKGLIDNNPFYRQTCSSLQQQRASATDYPSLVALLPNSSTLEGLINKPSYSQADPLLSSSLATKDSINNNLSHIVIYHFCSSKPHQAESPHFC